jgi:hypothetical protein
VRRRGAGDRCRQFDFAIAAASTGILRVAKEVSIVQIACCGYDATMGVGVLND